MNRLYLAGPMTGLPDFNYPAFNSEAARLRALGWTIENPAQNAAPAGSAWADYMRLALRQLLLCDGVALLPGWESSRGATLEVRIAGALLIPVMNARALRIGPAITTERIVGVTARPERAAMRRTA